jgi:hypothetical protein
MKSMNNNLWMAMLLGAALVGSGRAAAQDAQPPAPEAAPADKSPDKKPADKQPADKKSADGPLVEKQERVADRFRELERLLLRMAELTAPTDPRRAALLRQAVAQSKDRAIEQQFDELLRLLREERLAAVVKSQGQVHGDLVKLLELLLSEDRSKRIESEKERVREYIKRVNKIIKEQKAVQGETERQGEPKKLAPQQAELADKTGELAKDIDGGTPKPQPNSPPDKKPQGDPKDADKDSKPDDKPQGDKPKDNPKDGPKDDPKDDPKNDEPQDKDAKPKPAQSGDKGPKPGGQPGEPPPVEPPAPNEGQQGQRGEPGQPSQPNPAQKRLEQAQKRMQQAQQRLEEAKRKEAAEEQAEALRELEKAKAELEEILRQLREEEMSRTLAMLEARFRKMLDVQVEVYEGTKRLDKVPEHERDRDDEIEAGRLSRKEAEIATEAEKALDVLREEGSAVAFAEAVTGIRDDMYTVRDYLAKAQVGPLTQDVEKDVIAALEEMIGALQKAQKDLENKNQQQPQQQPGPGDMEMPLVDALSELKMIRALQMRVNTRTKRYGQMIETEQTDKPELVKALKDLAAREQRIHKVTRDIVVGRNR